MFTLYIYSAQFNMTIIPKKIYLAKYQAQLLYHLMSLLEFTLFVNENLM